MALPEMEMVKDAALKYDKPTLGRMAQMGQISPTIAVMAGMMRDRIVQSEMKPPAPPTVAEEIMQPMGQRMGLGAIAPGMGQSQQPPMQLPTPQGIDKIPVPDQMFEPQSMAGGGIVAFSNGGTPFRSFDTTRRILEELGLMDKEGNYIRPYRTEREKRLVEEHQSRAAAPLPLIDDSAEMAKFARQAGVTLPPPVDVAEMARLTRQAQGAGVPMGSTGLAAAQTRNLPQPEPAAVAAPAAPVLAAPTVPTAPAAPAQTDYLTRLQEMYRAAGVSAEPESAAAKELETDRKALDKSDKQANAMALIMAGLGIAGGESPYALVNLKGAIPALQQLGTDKKEINKLRRDYRKVETDLKLAADARKRGDVKTALDLEEKAGNRELKIREIVAREAGLDIQRAGLDIQRAGVEAQKAAYARPGETERMIAGLRRDDPKLSYTGALQKLMGIRQEPKSRDAARKDWADDLMLRKQYPNFEDYYAAVSGTTRTNIDPDLQRRADEIVSGGR